MSREAEKKRLIELLESAREEISKIFREKVKVCIDEKGNFNSERDIDRRSMYEIEADYLLDNGIPVPPCKVDDTLYLIDNDYFWEAKVIRVTMKLEHNDSSYLVFVRYTDGEIKVITNEESFGKTVFFSKEEAKHALKNRRPVSLVNGHIEE